MLPLPIGHHLRPSPALLSTVYLWGVHLSQVEAFTAHEQVFVSRALHQTANALASVHPHKVIHGIQAEVLLALYFFRAGRFLEGNYHASAAVSLTVSARLHKLRSVHRTNASADVLGAMSTVLPPPADGIEEGERITGFWTVYTLNTCWSAAFRMPPNVAFDAPGEQIDTPWPLELDQYERVRFLRPSTSYICSYIETDTPGSARQLHDQKLLEWHFRKFLWRIFHTSHVRQGVRFLRESSTDKCPISYKYVLLVLSAAVV